MQNIFVPADVNMIMDRQPVVSCTDSFTWKHNRSGNLTVKSAYWLAHSLKIQESFPEVLALPSVNPIKEKIWRIPTAQKIRIFLWKLMSEALPAAELIINRGMKVDGRCQDCGMEGESILHILFQCDVARQVRAFSGIPQPEFLLVEGNMFCNVNYLLSLKRIKRGDEEDKRAWPWILWFIWKSRNKFLFQGIRRSPEEIRLKAKKEANEWFLAQEVEKETPVAEAREVARTVRRWSPPKQGWLMCNVAFDWNKLRKILGVAWVVRNDRSVVVCHSRRAFSDISCLDDARLTRILWAIESMTSMHLSKIVFAGDFRELFLAVKKPFEWPALSHHGQEIKIRLGGLKDFQLRYVTTEENRGATFIAQSVTRQGRFQSYVANGPPSWLFEFFVNESRYL